MFSAVHTASATHEFEVADCFELQEAWGKLNDYFVRSVELSEAGSCAEVVSAIFLDERRGRKPLEIGSATELARQHGFLGASETLFVSYASTPPFSAAFAIEEQYANRLKQEVIFEFRQDEWRQVKLAITLNSSKSSPRAICLPFYIHYILCLKKKLQERTENKVQQLIAATKSFLDTSSPVAQSRKTPAPLASENIHRKTAPVAPTKMQRQLLAPVLEVDENTVGNVTGNEADF